MKNYTITEEQIKEVYNGCGLILKKWFPEVFETKLEAGKWYKHKYSEKVLVFMTEESNGYGFNPSGKFQHSENWTFEDYPQDWTLATDEEVFEALKNEAVKRGFKNGAYIEDIYCGNDFEIVSSNNFDYEEVPFCKYAGKMALRDKVGNILFVDGKWAEIIETLTKEEAEKKLNVKIID